MSTGKFFKRLFFIILILVLVGGGAYWWKIVREPIQVKDHLFSIENIDNPYSIAKRLEKENIIRSPFLFYATYIFVGKGNELMSGTYKLSTSMSVKQIIYTLQDRPWAKYINLPANVTKEEMGQIFAKELDWTKLDEQYFGRTLAGMQWQNYEEVLEHLVAEKYKWKRAKVEAFLTLSSLYYNNEYDFFKNMYIPGEYIIPTNASRAEVAGMIIDKFNEANKDKEEAVKKHLHEPTMENVAKLINEGMILLPDIVAIPPTDVVVKKEGGRTYILFTTTYANKGRGPLELLADPKTKGVAGDLNRDVYQRIYHLDGDYTERLAGKFLWHETHLHYHFEDFAVYEFFPVDIGGAKFDEVYKFKSTYCVRDSEPMDLNSPGANKDSAYKICGKEKQGISAGWADSYYYTYFDQRFDITNIPKGKYKLKFIINPEDRFDEVTLDNNIGEALLDIDPKEGTVTVIEEKTYGF